MRSNVPKKVSLVAAMGLICSTATADHYVSTVGELQPNHSTLDCFFFKLDGVTQTNPLSPNPGWFAVARSSVGAKEAYAAVLAARLTGMPIRVTTGGGLACSYPEATYINM